MNRRDPSILVVDDEVDVCLNLADIFAGTDPFMSARCEKTPKTVADAAISWPNAVNAPGVAPKTR